MAPPRPSLLAGPLTAIAGTAPTPAGLREGGEYALRTLWALIEEDEVKLRLLKASHISCPPQTYAPDLSCPVLASDLPSETRGRSLCLCGWVPAGSCLTEAQAAQRHDLGSCALQRQAGSAAPRPWQLLQPRGRRCLTQGPLFPYPGAGLPHQVRPKPALLLGAGDPAAPHPAPTAPDARALIQHCSARMGAGAKSVASSLAGGSRVSA